MAVSGCAHCPARPERLGRICRVSNNLLVQIGLLSATAPLPLSGQKKSVYAPAGRNLLRMPGLAAAAQEGPRVLFAPSSLHPMSQMRRERSESAKGSAQLDETKPIFAGRTKRPIKRRFSFVPGAARFLLPRQKKMWGAFLVPKRCPPAPVSALVFAKQGLFSGLEAARPAPQRNARRTYIPSSEHSDSSAGRIPTFYYLFPLAFCKNPGALLLGVDISGDLLHRLGEGGLFLHPLLHLLQGVEDGGVVSAAELLADVHQ